MLPEKRNIEISDADPFANDLLGRRVHGEALARFVLSTKEPLVICLDAKWGEGKTTFLRMWERLLRNQHVTTIRFNAWQNDFSSDALVSLIGEIGLTVDALKGGDEKSNAQQYFATARDLSFNILKRAVPVGVKLATAGLLDLNKDIEAALSGVSEKLVANEIARYEESKKTIGEFKNALTDLANSLSSSQPKQPLVFIIDELDRCRPTFAIEILEKAKHLFNVENVVFVLGADKTQLGHSVSAAYGVQLDAEDYLKRFIDINFLLPRPRGDSYIHALLSHYGFDDGAPENNAPLRSETCATLHSELTRLCKVFGLTLKEQGRCCKMLYVAARMSPPDELPDCRTLCFWIALKVKEHELYKQFVTSQSNYAQLITSLSAKYPGVVSYLADFGTVKQLGEKSSDRVSKHLELMGSFDI